MPIQNSAVRRGRPTPFIRARARVRLSPQQPVFLGGIINPLYVRIAVLEWWSRHRQTVNPRVPRDRGGVFGRRCRVLRDEPEQLPSLQDRICKDGPRRRLLHLGGACQSAPPHASKSRGSPPPIPSASRSPLRRGLAGGISRFALAASARSAERCGWDLGYAERVVW